MAKDESEKNTNEMRMQKSTYSFHSFTLFLGP